MVVKVEWGFASDISHTSVGRSSDFVFSPQRLKTRIRDCNNFSTADERSKAQITGGDLTMSEVLPTFDP